MLRVTGWIFHLLSKEVFDLNKGCFLWMGLLSAVFWSQGAAAYELQCPSFVNATSPGAVSAPEGWGANVRDRKLWVDGMGLISGPPEEMGVLKPEPFMLNGKERDGWNELDNPIDQQRGLWFFCSYATQYIVLTKKLDRPVQGCWMEEDVRTGPRPYTLYCKPAESPGDTGTGQ